MKFRATETATVQPSRLATSERVFFVASNSQVVDSLFTGPSTASGTYKIRKNGILFFDLQGIARVFLCANPNSDPFFVSCSYHTSKNGRRSLRYMQALCALDELWLDVRGMSYAEEVCLAKSLWAQVQSCA